MTVSGRRVRAIVAKELREYGRNRAVVATAAILPLVFLIQPLVAVFALPVAAATALRQEHTLLYLLGVPALVPSTLAAYAVVGERLQGTLEPVLATPIRRRELLLGKAVAAFIPSAAIAYGVFALFVAVVELFAHPAVAAAFVRGPELLAQVLFTPPLALWSVWVGIGVSARSRDPRSAGQLALLLSLPPVAVTSLVAFDVIPAVLPTALVLGAVLLLLDVLGWRAASALVDRERLVTGARA
ncbi:ABC transporter permease subunit [Nonomuraea sp. PA05]|uniref:ABC transporter permease n=1 Tax=Nonomuraea sp. PA05 TaxID=2604466 RepID=UPI0011DAAB1D|nr:ABC transporter permease subunit [Nonomuraea sp. PA05]TYB70960.1 ABC transporter permease subunit [Nonomuraea sp. PA05]